MKISDFSYELPEGLIAQYPLKDRSSSRLLYIDPENKISDASFKRFADYLQAGDLLVLNDTRVIPARLFAQKETGGKVAIMLERILDQQTLLVQLRACKSPKTGTRLLLGKEHYFTVAAHQDDLFLLHYFGPEKLINVFNRLGHMPLPPYISREDKAYDKEHYQTVFADKPGAVAAPTAGLHFTAELLAQLKEKGIDNTTLTLHVGSGTFKPVREDDITQHKMHSEYLQVPQIVVEKINATKKAKGRVIAVGTTVIRGLETAVSNGRLSCFEGETNIFIYPGFQFKVADMLLTNFHLSKSTLLMLVCAFAGKAIIMDSYQHAIKEKYRFYSYGDAMLIHKNVHDLEWR